MPLPFEGPATKTKHRTISPKGRRQVRLEFATVILYQEPNLFNRQTQTEDHQFPHLNGTQVTVSENHPLWKRRNISSDLSDIGGDFFTQRSYVDGSYNTPYNASGGETYYNGPTPWLRDEFRYHGAIMPLDPAFMSFPAPEASNLSALDALGATAIAASKPTNSVADLSVAMGEILSEGLPKLIGASTWRDRTLRAKNAGDEYLNYQFGWAPLVSEISDVASVIARGSRILAQYERDSGKVVRRRWNFTPSKSTEGSVLRTGVNAYVLGPVHSLQASGLRNQGKVHFTRESVIQRWFAGAFTYYLPPQGTVAGEYLRAKKLYGTGLTPETVWNLTPWSWAADWFSNAGDVLSNVSSIQQDGLVLRYGYVMEHSVTKHTYTYAGPTGYVGSAYPAPVTLVTETKVRKRATPFGFGLNWADFSAQQLSIATALGLSRT